MNAEIEAKFVNLDHDEVRASLIRLEATLIQPMRMMRRVAIDTPIMQAKNAYLRIRDEGDKVTVTYKQFDSRTIDGAKEIEVTINDFETAVALFAASGLTHTSYQESRRETWHLGEVEIVLDIWPWLNPYIEIEGPSVEMVMDVANRLGLDWNDAVFGGVMAAYHAQYPHTKPEDTVGNLPFVRFNDPVPKMFL